MNIRHGSRAIKSGVVTEDTKITFRSRSSRIIWLVQISSEMWDYASPYEARNNNSNSHFHGPTCEIYFDKFTSFMYKLFEKWNELEVCTQNLFFWDHKLFFHFFTCHHPPTEFKCLRHFYCWKKYFFRRLLILWRSYFSVELCLTNLTKDTLVRTQVI